MKVTIDTARCQGYGNCIFAAPDLFDLDDETNVAVLKKSDFDGADRQGILDAVADCPASAIITDES